MEFKTLVGDTSIPVLGLGTWKMGGGDSRSTSHDKEEILAIKSAIEMGMTHIDTAEYYGNGHAEELVCEAIKPFERRDLFITTKVKGSNLRHDEVIQACKSSLKRLGIDYIDLYLVHWPNSRVPVEQTMKAMDWLVEEGLVRFIGVSNFTVKEMEEAQRFAKNKILANQIEFNLLTRTGGMFTNNMETEIIPYCQKNRITVVTYRPLARGQLAKPGIKILDEIAKKYSKTQAQVAINWLISKDNVISIPKASKIEHLKDNIGSIGWKLENEDIERLDRMD